MYIIRAWLAALFCAVGVLALRHDDSTKSANFQHNLNVIPLVEASTDRAYQLHRYIYSLFWLKRRIAFGDEKHFLQIPQVSFFMDPHYYEAKVASFWIDTSKENLKSVNITISVPKITELIQALEDEAQQRRIQLQQQKIIGDDEKQGEKAIRVPVRRQVNRKQDPKIPEHHIDHYYYYLQAEYHCVIPPGDPSKTCQSYHYLLDAIYIQIYPVTDPDKRFRLQ